MGQFILDVREANEYSTEHIEGSLNLPLSDLNPSSKETLSNIKADEIVVMCRSGMRAKLALEKLKSMDLNHHKITVYEGGIIRWKNEGNPTITAERKPLCDTYSINRQVHLVAFIILATGMFFQGTENILRFTPYLVCFGLALDAFTGFCPMRFFLKFAPWNKA